mgnify:CR=1 FL=1
METLENGSKYKGTFEGGLRHGYGVSISPKGTQCHGTWKSGKLEGAGKIVKPSGESIWAVWKDGMRVDINQKNV